MFSTIVTNLRVGLCAFFWPAQQAVAIRPSVSSIIVSLSLSIILLAVFSYAGQTGEVFFDHFSAACLGSVLFIAMLTALMVCSIQKEHSRFIMLISVVINILPWYLVFSLSLIYFLGFSEANYLVCIALLYWAVILLTQCVRLSFAEAKPESFILVSGVTIILAVAFYPNFYTLDLFYSYADDSDEVYTEIDREKVYYQQYRLMSDKLSTVLAHTPGEEDIYFLGFAGNGNEKIFGRELSFVGDIVEQRFNTKGRSLLLSSSSDSLDTQPLANYYNLTIALNELATRMDTKEDVLFLFLTSHGSDDGSIQVALDPFDMREVNSKNLSAALNDSGIQWRIIVISACYSGSFIDDLADDNTLILTAAAFDKASFGCSDDRELTYFGEAFFSRALLQKNGLLDAFDSAKEYIEAKEIEEGLTVSEPQIHMGSIMLSKLQGMGLIDIDSPKLHTE